MVDDLIRHQIGTVGVEGAAPGRCVHEYGAHREQVRRRPHFPGSLELLGRHEGRCPDQLSGLRPQVTVGRPRDPEVDDPYSVGCHQDVARLQIPVHHTGPVDVPQGLGESGAEPGQFGRIEHPLPHPLGECRCVDEQGRHPGPFGVRIRVHDGRGERPAHTTRRGHFLPEPGPELRIHRVFGVHDLDGEFQSRRGGGEVDDAHTARTQDGFQPVLPGVLRKARPIPAQRLHR